MYATLLRCEKLNLIVCESKWGNDKYEYTLDFVECNIIAQIKCMPRK